MKPAGTVMAGLVPVCPVMTVKVTRTANRISYWRSEEIPSRLALRWRMVAVGLAQPVCLLF
jgi:hypothetical protein